MNHSFFRFAGLAMAGFVSVGWTTLNATAAETVLQFSDPSQPGKLVVQIGLGDVTIVGEDRRDVLVHGDVSAPAPEKPREDGLRRLDGGSSFAADEKNNVITVTAANLFPGKHGARKDADLTIAVPRDAAVTLERAGPGDTIVRGLSGNLEVRSPVGDVDLEELAGGVLVEAVNGNVVATFAQVPDDRPVAMNVINGDVTLQLPVDARANLRMRSLRGEMLTDFGEDRLQSTFDGSGPGGGGEAWVTAEADRARALADTEQARAQAERDRAAAEQQRRRDQGAAGMPVPPVPPTPKPMPLLPPPMAGGKLVTGVLNGGGTEISITTLTGDITVRRRE